MVVKDEGTTVRYGADDPIRYCTVGGAGSTRSRDLHIKRVGASAPVLQSLLLFFHHRHPYAMAKNLNRKKGQEYRSRKDYKRTAVHLQAVPRTVKPSSITQTTTATVAVSPRRSPSVPPDALATQPQPAFHSPRGRSQHRRTLSSDSESSFSPPPSPKQKRARQVAEMSDLQVTQRYRKVRISMEIVNATWK